jgi:hypothetical protein
MMKNFKLIMAVFIVSVFTGSVVAGIVDVPSTNPVITVHIPDSWKPEDTDKGVSCESPDGVVTIFFEIVKSERGMKKLIDENVDWLVTDQGVKIDASTKNEQDIAVGGIKSSLIGYDADSKEYGPAKVGFIFTPVGDKLLVTTYWLTVEDYDKQDARVNKILESVTPVE